MNSKYLGLLNVLYHIFLNTSEHDRYNVIRPQTHTTI